MASVGIVVAIPVLVVLLLVGTHPVVSVIVGLVAGLLAGSWLVLPRVRSADRSVLESFPGHPADDTTDARLLNLVEGLVLSIGIAEPDVRIVDDPARNAMSVAAQGRHTIVVTRGLLESLERIELEGVVAELLVRLKDGDAEMGTAASSLLGGLFLDGPLRPFRSFGVARMQALFDDDRDLIADRDAVGVTRYPPGLAAALSKMKSSQQRPAGSSPGTDHLWLVPPSDSLVATHPIDLRIDVLQEI